jgi:putative peptidoglycan lipid II flippase
MKKSLIKAVGIITIIAIFSKVLGFGRELLMAAYFGASSVTDAYFVASIIPVLMLTAIGMAITSGMAPIYAEAKAKGGKEPKDVISVLTTLFVVISIIVTILFYIFMPYITKFVAPGFQSNQLELTNKLTAIMLPSFCFLVLSSIMTGILEYEKKFAPPALVAIPQNLFIILAVIFLSKRFGIYSIAVATLVGAISQTFIQYPFIKKFDVFKVNFHFKKFKVVITDAVKVFSPLIIASVAYQITAVVDRMVASHLPEGSVSAINYSNKLMYLPLSIVLLSLVTVLFPIIVDAAVEKREKLAELIFKGINIITFVGIPITVIMLSESQLLVDIAYKRGVFGTTASLMTSQAFYFYTFGMVFVALKEFLNRCFVAIRETKVTMVASVCAVILNVILDIVLSRFMSVGGIALASSIAMAFQAILLFCYLPKKSNIKISEIKEFCFNFGKLLLTFLSLYIIVNFLNETFQGENDILRLIITTAVSFILFSVISWLLGCKEIHWIVDILKEKRRSKSNV